MELIEVKEILKEESVEVDFERVATTYSDKHFGFSHCLGDSIGWTDKSKEIKYTFLSRLLG
jgi:hypothetical protein